MFARRVSRGLAPSSRSSLQPTSSVGSRNNGFSVVPGTRPLRITSFVFETFHPNIYVLLQSLSHNHFSLREVSKSAHGQRLYTIRWNQNGWSMFRWTTTWAQDFRNVCHTNSAEMIRKIAPRISTKNILKIRVDNTLSFWARIRVENWRFFDDWRLSFV